jgi:hypothetical protein
MTAVEARRRKSGPSAPMLSFEEIRRLIELVAETGLSVLFAIRLAAGTV